jgi:arylsulfatase A-like enzyme
MTRIRLRFALPLAIWAALVFQLGLQNEAVGRQRPNVVVVLIDDMGFSDLSCYGGEIPTPNIDALAAGGIRFTQFYNSGRCSPTRAALLTGLYPHQAGLGNLDNVIIENSKGTQGRLRDDCATLPEVLGDAGYFTIMTGKWHLGQDHGTPPWVRGFMRSLSASIGETYFPNQSQQREDGLRLNGERHSLDDPVFGKDWYSSDLFTQWGLKFIDEAIAAKKPFFYYLPHTAVHFPLMAPREDIDRYRGKYLVGWDKLREDRYRRLIKLGLIDSRCQLTPRPSNVPAWDTLSPKEKDRYDQIMAIYAAVSDRLDRSVGTLVAGLQERGVLDNTLIIVFSDNGGTAESGLRGRLEGGEPGGPDSVVYLGQAWATLTNTPFRSYKHFTYEGGIATPLILHWPAGIVPDRNGKLETQPSYVIDFMPTLLELCGGEYPSQYRGQAIQPMEGVSLVPALRGMPIERDEPIFFYHEGNRAVRSGKWKLVMRCQGSWELYDMETDRTECHNLIDDQPELAKQLIAQWQAWAKRSDVEASSDLAIQDSGDPAPQVNVSHRLRHIVFFAGIIIAVVLVGLILLR